MVITLGQQYNVGEKPTVILYTYINRHAGTPTKGKTNQYIIKNPIQSLKRAQQRTMMMRIFIIQVHDPVIHLRCVADVNGLERDVHLVCHMVGQVDLVSRIAHGKLVDFADVNTKRHSWRCDLERCVLRLGVIERTRHRITPQGKSQLTITTR